jgi:prevent-host-death family protein
MPMDTMAVSAFKAKALEIIENVAKNQQRLIITKRGKPIAEIVPYRDHASKPVAGRLAGSLLFEKDIVSPLGEKMWDACR